MKIRDIFIIIALLLVLGVAVTMVVFINKSEATTADETTAAMITEKPEETSASTVATTAKVSDYELRESGAGYKTIDNTTYFFMTEVFPSEYVGGSINFSGDDFGDHNCIFRYSYDLKTFELCSSLSTLNQIGIGASYDRVYLSYCSVTGCSDPDAVLDVLESNVFGNESYYKVWYLGGIG